MMAITIGTSASTMNGTRSERGPFSLPPLKLQKRMRLTISSAATMDTASAT